MKQIQIGEGWIVFHHFRKSAGTSIISFLRSITSHKTKTISIQEKFLFRAGPMTIYRQEWGAFPSCCLTDPNEPLSFLITALRNQTSKILSEFDYAGPGKSTVNI